MLRTTKFIRSAHILIRKSASIAHTPTTTREIPTVLYFAVTLPIQQLLVSSPQISTSTAPKSRRTEQQLSVQPRLSTTSTTSYPVRRRQTHKAFSQWTHRVAQTLLHNPPSNPPTANRRTPSLMIPLSNGRERHHNLPRASHPLPDRPGTVQLPPTGHPPRSRRRTTTSHGWSTSGSRREDKKLAGRARLIPSTASNSSRQKVTLLRPWKGTETRSRISRSTNGSRRALMQGPWEATPVLALGPSRIPRRRWIGSGQSTIVFWERPAARARPLTKAWMLSANGCGRESSGRTRSWT